MPTGSSNASRTSPGRACSISSRQNRHSSHPDDSRSDVYEGEEVYCFSVVSGCDAAEMFDFVEVTFDAVTVFVDFGVIADEALSRWIAGDDGLGLDVGDAVADGIGVVSSVGEHMAGPKPLHQRQGPWRVAGLSGREDHAERAPEGVAGDMDFCRQSASGTPQSLVPAPPFPVAAC